MKVCSTHRHRFALSLITIALSQSVYAADAPAQLPDVTVTAAPTGDTQGYTVPVVKSATKTDTPILETPMAVQVVPHEVTDDRQTLTVAEAIKNLSGVQANPGRVYDNYTLRGFQSVAWTWVDGLKVVNMPNVTDMAFVDHIEVIKGPAGMLYGQIQPGGLVNVVTKKPQAESSASLQQQVGSWGLLRTTADATGKVNESGSTLYRIIGAYDKGDSWVDYVHHDSKNLATYFSFKPSEHLNVNVDWEHTDAIMSAPQANGQIPVIGSRPANVPRNFNASSPVMWDSFPWTIKRDKLRYDWTYYLNGQWKLSNRFQYVKSDETTAGLPINAFNGVNTVTKFALNYGYTPSVDINTNLDLEGNFKAWGANHKMLAGVDYFHYDLTEYGAVTAGTFTTLPTINIFNPIQTNTTPLIQAQITRAANNVYVRQGTTNKGLYIQDQASLAENWELLVGGRYDTLSQYASSVLGAATAACYPNCDSATAPSAADITAFTPHGGVLYKLSKDASLYASYSESFGSNNGFDAAGKPFDPQRSKQYELGAKASLLDGRITTSATLFDLYLTNRLTPDPANPTFNIAAGEVRSSGLEFDVAGQATEHVKVIASYTYDNAYISKDNTTGANAIVGKDWAGVAKNTASLWGKYDTAPGAADGWAFGAGTYLIGDRQGNNTNTYQVPGYVRLDAMMGYRTKAIGRPLTVQLNVQNVLDAWYFEATDGATNAFYGAPRTITASAKVDL